MFRFFGLAALRVRKLGRRGRALFAASMAVVLAISVAPALAAVNGPSMKLALFDGMVIVTGEDFDEGDVELLASVEGGSGGATAEANEDGTFVVGFSLPTTNFKGTVTVNAQQGEIDLSKSARIGGTATKKSTTGTTTTKSTTDASNSGKTTTKSTASKPSATDEKPTATAADDEEKSKTIKIMAFGDSIVSGQNLGAARTELWKRFEEDGYKIDFVGGSDQEKGGPGDLPDKDHEGYSGWKTSDLLSKANAINEYDPDIIYVSMGGNDQFQGKIGEVEDNYRKIVQTWCTAKPGIKIAAATNHDFGGKDFTELNSIIAGVVSEMSSSDCDIQLVKMEGVVQGRLADGVHPNAEGYAAMGDKWYPTLKKMADEVLAQ